MATIDLEPTRVKPGRGGKLVAGVDSAVVVAAWWSPPPSAVAVGEVGGPNEWRRESLDSSNCNDEEDVRSIVSCDVLWVVVVVVVVNRNRSFCDRNPSRRRSSKLLPSGTLFATIFAATFVDVVEEGFLAAVPPGDDDDGVVLDRLLTPWDEELELRVDSDRETNPMINQTVHAR
jgi:hypothetical protein